jgi:V8-like Glu-specific endopeptidase
MLIAIIIYLFSVSVDASTRSIFDGDDRQEYYQIKNQSIKELSVNSVALILKEKMISDGDKYRFVGPTLEKTFNLCSDSRFAKQQLNASCSGVMLNEDTVVTAAHCVSPNKDDWFYFKNYNIVLDYKNTSSQNITTVPKSSVYSISKILAYEFDHNKMTDLAILKLSIKTKRPGVKVSFNYALHDRVFVLGYPLGIPMKLSNDSVITEVKDNIHSFRHELDTFSVNSGSPIFNTGHEVIGVHTRGTGGNIKSDGRDCRDWWQGKSDTDFGEANNLTPLRAFFNKKNLITK